MIRDLSHPRLWQCTCKGGVLYATDETGGVSIELAVPGYLVDYVGKGCIIRANIAEGQFVIHEKVYAHQ